MNRVLDGLCNEQGLEIEYVIPDGVSSLKVFADLRGKTLTSSMTIGAPEDRKTSKARVNWLLRQLAKTQRGRYPHQGRVRAARRHPGGPCQSA